MQLITDRPVCPVSGAERIIHVHVTELWQRRTEFFHLLRVGFQLHSTTNNVTFHTEADSTWRSEHSTVTESHLFIRLPCDSIKNKTMEQKLLLCALDKKCNTKNSFTSLLKLCPSTDKTSDKQSADKKNRLFIIHQLKLANLPSSDTKWLSKMGHGSQLHVNKFVTGQTSFLLWMKLLLHPFNSPGLLR